MAPLAAEYKYPIQQILASSFETYRDSHFLTDEQLKAAYCIIDCKTGRLGTNFYECEKCGHIRMVPRSCGNRNCPNCQAVEKSIWLEQRKAEVIDAPYFHIVGTLPHELNSLLAANKKILYELLHKSMGSTLTSLALDRKYLGAAPGIIQVLHTWDQKLLYHVHVHCVVSGGGLTPEKKLVTLKKDSPFFIPVKVISAVYRGKFMEGLRKHYSSGKLTLPDRLTKLRNSYEWQEFIRHLYSIEWNVYIKETFNGNGNAIKYLSSYTNRIAISNSRIISYDKKDVTFSYLDRKDGSKRKELTISTQKFIHRFMQHVLPKGFQKIRYYGYLNNSTRKENLKRIFEQQGGQKYTPAFEKTTPFEEVAFKAWGINLKKCPCCGNESMIFITTSMEITEKLTNKKCFPGAKMRYHSRARPK